MDEDRIITESVAKEGQNVHATINSKGWTDVIRPALVARNEALLRELLNAKTYEEFVTLQQSMNAINGLLSFIEIKLIEGKEALVELKKDM